uniref:CTF/NF-I domain-containing protein n=1 Tax=Macrostomum lignano TaxID=282301 RepID=A0A1I8FBQ4_9PLAT
NRLPNHRKNAFLITGKIAFLITSKTPLNSSSRSLQLIPIPDPNSPQDMSETDLAEIVANLLKKVFKEIQDDCREAFVRAWLREDDTRCVLTVPDGKGKMKRIDGLRGSDKLLCCTTAVPMDSTDTGLLVHRCEDELCVNPRHLSFQCSPAMMAVAMEMLHVAGYDVTPRLAAAAAADPSGNGRYFQFTSPFTVDVIRREMSESIGACRRSVLDRYQLSTDDAAYVAGTIFPETMSTYRRLLAGDGRRRQPPGSVSRASTVGACRIRCQQYCRHRWILYSAASAASSSSSSSSQHRDRSFLASLSSSAAGLRPCLRLLPPRGHAKLCRFSRRGGGWRAQHGAVRAPTNAQMPFKKRQTNEQLRIFTPAAAVSDLVYGAAAPSSIGGLQATRATPPKTGRQFRRSAATFAASLRRRRRCRRHQLQQQQSQSHFDSHHQSHTEDEIAEI